MYSWALALTTSSAPSRCRPVNDPGFNLGKPPLRLAWSMALALAVRRVSAADGALMLTGMCWHR